MGIVLRARGGIYDVETSEGVLEAVLRGRLKRDDRSGDRVVAGDRVVLAREAPGEAWTIEEVEERRSALVRRAPGKAPRPKVIAANVDRVVVVFAARHPDPHLRMLDRFLVLCESSELDALIVVNKIDLAGEYAARELFKVYEEIGYPVLYTSAEGGLGIAELREAIRGDISVFTGPSGVGKSSLLNRIQPGLGLRVGAVSETVNKGRHTTVNAELIRLDCGGYVVDTPGLRELALWEVDPANLAHYFPEFRDFLGTCRYGNSCTHSHEPGCAVQAAVAQGGIHRERYVSYLRMLAPDDEAARR